MTRRVKLVPPADQVFEVGEPFQIYPLSDGPMRVLLDVDGVATPIPLEWVEDVPDPLPPEPAIGSVVLDRNGTFWQRLDDGRWGARGPHGAGWFWGDINRGNAPLTVIHEPGVTRVVVPDPEDEAAIDRLFSYVAREFLLGSRDQEILRYVLRALTDGSWRAES